VDERGGWVSNRFGFSVISNGKPNVKTIKIVEVIFSEKHQIFKLISKPLKKIRKS
jgi:hypothetical protein